MKRAFFPFRFVSSHALSQALGCDLEPIAVAAVRAVLRQNKSFAVAHQQIEVGQHHVALSTRVTEAGDLIVDLELGDPRLAKRLITEEDLNRAMEQSRVKSGLARANKGRLRR
jgi:hypothetical protein